MHRYCGKNLGCDMYNNQVLKYGGIKGRRAGTIKALLYIIFYQVTNAGSELAEIIVDGNSIRGKNILYYKGAIYSSLIDNIKLLSHIRIDIRQISLSEEIRERK